MIGKVIFKKGASMRVLTSKLLLTFLVIISSQDSLAFTAKISGEEGALGEKAEAKNCRALGGEAFTTNAGQSVYSNERTYSGDRSIKMTVNRGSQGFGTFGGTLQFNKCKHIGGRDLRKGDEVWLRVRMLFPEDFEFNRGRNKFIRFRAYNMINGKKVSEGYDDLYINGHPEQKNFNPFWFIFEGEANWYTVGEREDFFEFGEWKTIELYLKFDNKKKSQGGDARVRIWVDGKLIGDTGERRTLKTPTSYVPYVNIFTWYGNEGSPKTQSLYMDDFVLTTDTPSAKDGNGNHYIGMGDSMIKSAPKPPTSIGVN